MTTLEELEALVSGFGSESTGYNVSAELIPIVIALQKTVVVLKGG